MAKRLKDETVLIIEDDAETRTFTCRVLELEGYDCLQAKTGDEAFQLMKEYEINLVLLDLWFRMVLARFF